MRFHEFIRLIEADPPAAKAAIELNENLLKMRNEPGETPLHYLVVENCIGAVNFLRELGADIDTSDEFGTTPLMHAIRLNYRDMIEYLLLHGANVDAKTVNDDTALSYAVMKEDVKTLNRLIKLCKREIQFYFSDLEASEIASDPSTELRRHIVSLGLTDPYAVGESDGE